MKAPWALAGTVDPCCCDTDCCLYPWPDPDGTLGGPFYPDTDLPDTITVTITGGINAGVYDFDRVPGEYRYTSSDPSLAGAEIRAGLNDGVDPAAWVAAFSFYGTAPTDFLICDFQGGIVVTDQFSNTYTFSIVTGLSGATRTCTVTRDLVVSSCRWTGNITFLDGDWVEDAGAGTYPVLVSYPSPEANLFGFGASITFQPEAGGPFSADKSAPQTDPTGAYSVATVT